ncbi:MAG TPA: hypothetical protein VN613_04745 [Gemmatimonadaceae bacterium]|nr:hypothetical protein [Gemmatimonadaceae bacterium]
MIFKDPKSQQELAMAPQKLKDVVARFEELSMGFGIEPVCTRVKGKVAGDSGVHAAWRAADFRDQIVGDAGSHNLYTPEQVQEILDTLNKEFPRNDDKSVAIHHSFDGMPFHFHLQVPIAWLSAEEIRRLYGGLA